MPHFPHLTSYTPTKSNLYLANSLVTAVSDGLLIFHAPNLMSLFHCCGRTKGSVQVRGTCICLVKGQVLGWGVLRTSPNPHAEVSHLVCCPRLLIHPQLVDAPCRGYKDPPIMEIYIYIYMLLLVSLGQGWRTYCTQVQNSMRKCFLGTGHYLLSQFFTICFSRPDSRNC